MAAIVSQLWRCHNKLSVDPPIRLVRAVKMNDLERGAHPGAWSALTGVGVASWALPRKRTSTIRRRGFDSGSHRWRVLPGVAQSCRCARKPPSDAGLPRELERPDASPGTKRARATARSLRA